MEFSNAGHPKLKTMKTRIAYICLLLMMSAAGFCQHSDLNRRDAKGKKDGRWIVCLDKDWRKTEDSSKVLYYRFTWFEQGVNIYPMGPCGRKGYRLEPALPENGEPVLLDGEYKWYDTDGKLSSVHVFKLGEYISCKEYFRNGKLSQHFDYTKKCEGEDQGWMITIYDKNGMVKTTAMTCKDKNGKWPLMRD